MRSGTITLGKRRSMTDFLFELLALLYIAHKLLPVLGVYMPGSVYLGNFLLVLVLACFIGMNKFTARTTLQLIAVFGVSLLEFLSRLIRGPIASGFIYFYGEIQIFLYALIAIVLIYRADNRQIKSVTRMIFVFYGITAFTTFIGNNQYEGASRLMATLDNNDPTRQLYASANIGGFALIYELVLIAPLIVYLVKKRKINMILGIGFIALLGITIFNSEYTTALLMYVLSLILFLIPKITKRKILVIVVVLAILFVFNSMYFADMFDNLSQTVESETLAARFGELADFLREGESTDDSNAANRLNLYRKSIKTFFSSGMLGAWKNSSIGGHSFVFDTMGKFGLLGVALMIIMYRIIYKMFINPYKKEDFYPYVYYTYLIAIFMAFINPKTYFFIFICIIPLFARTMVIKRIEREGF